VAGCCEHSNETSGSIKGGEIIEYLRDYWFLKAGLCSMESVGYLVIT